MQSKIPVYPYNAKTAQERGEIEKWRESFRENCACAGGIDILIRENFDGMHLKDGTVEKIVELYGYKRVEHVLANTVQERRGDGRFRPDNRVWAESHYIPEDEMHNYCFAARSHSAILDGFISNYRKLVMDLGMFDQKQCEPDSSELDYTGKVLVLSPNTLKEEYWSPENQLWLAESGFGCSPTARGRSILCTCLGDGEQTRWNRKTNSCRIGRKRASSSISDQSRQKNRKCSLEGYNMPFMKPYMVKLLREQFPLGTRVRLESEMNDPQPIPTGMTGTVQGIDDAGQLLMEWDNGRGLSLVPGEDDFTVVKPQKLKLYMPLALGYYEKNDWGDYEDEELTLSDDDAVGYADTITGALEREAKFLDTPRGFMEYYNRSDGVDAKVRSLFFKAEARNGKLWGVAECMVSGELNGEELAKLKDYIAGQASDGIGESVEQHEIRVGSMELYAHLWQPVDWRIQTEHERFEQEQTGGMTLAQSM